MDSATGLVYVGNGQYYDPATGRFLSRGVYPGSPNPYVPWQGDPLGMLVGPLVLLTVFRGKRKAGKIDQVLMVVVVVLAVGVTVTGCSNVDNPNTTAKPTDAYYLPTLPAPTPTQLTIITPTQTPQPTGTPSEETPTTMPSSCSNGVWYSGSNDDNDNLEVIAKRIYFEGASSFIGGEIRKNVFMAQAWALRTLRAYLYGLSSSYTWITQNAFSVSSQKDSEPWYEDNDYKEITRCILNSLPCAYDANPWSIKAPGKAIQWISPQNLNRRDALNEPVWVKSREITGCSEGSGCQLPDMRSRSWILQLPGLVGKVESFVDLGLIDTIGDDQPNYNECYWKGLYFFSDQNGFQTAANGIYNPPPTSDEQESLRCPAGGSGERWELPPMPDLYSSQ